MQNEIFFFTFSYLYSHLLVTLYVLTILLRDPEGSGNLKNIFLNWSTEESLFDNPKKRNPFKELSISQDIPLALLHVRGGHICPPGEIPEKL